MKRLFSLLIVVLALVITGCGAGESEETTGKGEKVKADDKEPKASKDLGDYHVSFGGNISEEDDKFIIEGESNLLPGSRLVGEVQVENENEIEVFSDTTELVQDDGTFYMELEHHQYGEAEIVIRFDFDSVQDDEIKRHYGDKGQKLEGPFIYKHKEYAGILKKAEAKVEYIPNESTDLAIVAPKWHELPEDYGDPRVWIEIEELTEDGEFFYINGKSNILEGSEISVSYGYNNDKTQVNPDGTFDFKVDYEYLEDKDFIIEFKPYDFQWNEIEEAYGKDGQKLVGDLVVTNKYSTDRQYIEKHVKLDEFIDKKTNNNDENEASKDKESEEEKEGEESEDEEKDVEEPEKEEK